MRSEKMKRAIGLMALVVTAASLVAGAEEGLERAAGLGDAALGKASLTLGVKLKGFGTTLAQAGAPNSADPYVPRRDRWGAQVCLPGWELVNRDYISPSAPGVVINPSCIRGGNKALRVASIPGLPGHYYPGAIDSPPDVGCGIGRQLAYVGNDQWACLTAPDHEGHDRADVSGREGVAGGADEGGHGEREAGASR